MINMITPWQVLQLNNTLTIQYWNNTY